MLQFVAGEHEPDEPRPGKPQIDEPQIGKPHLVLKLGQARGPMGVVDAPGLTPVMTRLGPDELQTLETLITAGIASSRAEGARAGSGAVSAALRGRVAGGGAGACHCCDSVLYSLDIQLSGEFPPEFLGTTTPCRLSEQLTPFRLELTNFPHQFQRVSSLTALPVTTVCPRACPPSRTPFCGFPHCPSAASCACPRLAVHHRATL